MSGETGTGGGDFHGRDARASRNADRQSHRGEGSYSTGGGSGSNGSNGSSRRGESVGGFFGTLGTALVGSVLVDTFGQPIANATGARINGDFSLFGRDVRYRVSPDRLRNANVSGGLVGGVGYVDDRGRQGVTALGNSSDNYGHFVSLVAEAQLTHNPNKYAEALAFGEMLARNDQKPGKVPGSRDPDRINFPSNNSYLIPLPNNPNYGIQFTGDDWTPVDAVGHVASMISQNSGQAPVFEDRQFMQQAEAAYRSGSWQQANTAGESQQPSRNSQQTGGNGQQQGDHGQFALGIAQQTAGLIANMPVYPVPAANYFSSVSLEDPQVKARFEQSIASATPEQLLQIKKLVHDGAAGYAQRIEQTPETQFPPVPPKTSAQIKADVAQVPGQIGAQFDQVVDAAVAKGSQGQGNSQGQASATDVNATKRIEALGSIHFSDAEKEKQWQQLLGQEKESMKGGFSAFFTKIISMIVNAIGGHPEMNSPEAFIEANGGTGLAGGVTKEQALNAIKTGTPLADIAQSPGPGTQQDQTNAQQPPSPATIAAAKVENWATLSQDDLHPDIAAGKVLQTELKAVGAFNGPINGKVGPMTTESIKRVETLLGMTMDGKDDAKLEAALKQPDVIKALQAAIAAGTTGGDTVTGAGTPPGGANRAATRQASTPGQ